jgi:hypothetical protein
VKREGKLAPRVQKVWDEFAQLVMIDELPGADELNGRRLVVEIGSGQGNQIVAAATGASAETAASVIASERSECGNPHLVPSDGELNSEGSAVGGDSGTASPLDHDAALVMTIVTPTVIPKERSDCRDPHRVPAV